MITDLTLRSDALGKNVRVSFMQWSAGENEEPNNNSNSSAWWIFTMVCLFTCALTVVFAMGAKLWGSLQGRLQRIERRVNSLHGELVSAWEQAVLAAQSVERRS